MAIRCVHHSYYSAAIFVFLLVKNVHSWAQDIKRPFQWISILALIFYSIYPIIYENILNDLIDLSLCFWNLRSRVPSKVACLADSILLGFVQSGFRKSCWCSLARSFCANEQTERALVSAVRYNSGVRYTSILGQF